MEYVVTEEQYNKVIHNVLDEISQNEIFLKENSFDENGRMVKLIQIFLDTVLVPRNNLICKALIIRYEEDDDYYIRIWINQNEPHTQDDSDDLVDTIWNGVYDMFGVSTAIHRVKGDC